MNAEMTHHLAYEKHGSAGEGVSNTRNGTGPKTLEEISARYRLMCRGIGTAAWSRRSSNTNADSQASMTRSCRCMREE